MGDTEHLHHGWFDRAERDQMQPEDWPRLDWEAQAHHYGDTLEYVLAMGGALLGRAERAEAALREIEACARGCFMQERDEGYEFIKETAAAALDSGHQEGGASHLEGERE